MMESFLLLLIGGGPVFGPILFLLSLYVMIRNFNDWRKDVIADWQKVIFFVFLILWLFSIAIIYLCCGIILYSDI